MRCALLLALVLPCVGTWGEDTSETGEGITIGIVGAGLGGAATAYYVRQALPNATIIVLEKDSIGGRVRTVSFNGATGIELGGSTWHSSHHQMNQLCEALEIPTMNPLKRADGSTSGPYGVWNGRDVVFKQSASDIGMVLNMIWRYGLSPLYTQRIVDEVSDKLEEASSLLASGQSWGSHERLLRQLHLYDTSQQDLRSLLRDHGFNAAFMDEIIEGIIRNNYGQSLSGTNALAGLMALKSGSDELLSAKGGNLRIVEELIKKADCQLLQEAKVVSLFKSSGWNGSSTVTIKYDRQGTEHTLLVDAAVLAAPADLAGIDILDNRRTRYQTNPGSYMLLHVTLVLCNGLSPHYFRLLKSDRDPTLLLTMEEDVAVFNSLGLHRKASGHVQAVYKVLSREHMAEELLDKMFVNKTDVMRHTWHAYPELRQAQSYPPLRIDDNIYYPTGFEKVLPIMEGTVLSARNIVTTLLADVHDMQRVKKEAAQRSEAEAQKNPQQEDEEEVPEKKEETEEATDDWYRYLSNIVTEDEDSAAQEPKEAEPKASEPEDTDSWFSFLSNDEDPAQPQAEASKPTAENKAEAAAPVEEAEAKPEAEVEAEAEGESWFSFFGEEAEPTEEATEPAEEREQSEQEQGDQEGAWSWLG